MAAVQAPAPLVQITHTNMKLHTNTSYKGVRLSVKLKRLSQFVSICSFCIKTMLNKALNKVDFRGSMYRSASLTQHGANKIKSI